MNKISWICFLCLNSILLFSQESSVCDCPGQHKTGKGTFYISWGYNLSWYSKSDIHFENSGTDNYDFTLYDLSAKDRRSDYNNFLKQDLTIPQYAYRLGYYFNDKRNFGVEINFDHTKYVMDNNQVAHLKGTIRGQSFDLDTLVGEEFLKFEHSDGANFMMLNFLKRKYVYNSLNKKHWLSATFKGGAGIVIPKTKVRLFGEELDNEFHIGGYVAGLEIGLRYDLFKYFFVEPSVKGVFANYTDVLVIGTGKAHHHFWAFETIGTFGFQFPL